MALTDAFVLPAGTVLLPAGELPEALRREIQADENDFAISRPNSRTQSKVIDQEAATLLRYFEKPCTIAQAVARYSQGHAEKAEGLLDNAFPLLQSLIAAQLLVTEDSKQAEEIKPTLATNDTVAGWSVLQCVQSLEDTELFQMQTPKGELAALKIARPGAGSAVRSMLDREASILERLDGKVTPKVLKRGEWLDRPYLLTEWFIGADVYRASEEFRRSNSRIHLLQLAVRILDCYSALHEQDVVHGDVHPRNLLVDRLQAVKIIDFGLARNANENQALRGGVGFFLEPEFAQAVLNGTYPPPLTKAGEQYAVAVLLYFIFTGLHYLDFLLEKSAMLRQVAEDPMAPFVQRGVQPWPEVERLLAKALSKNPAERFPSMAALRDAFHAISIAPVEIEFNIAGRSGFHEMKGDWVRKLGFEGRLLEGDPLPSPSTSVNYGSAGIAYALYRMACATEDAELLALADAWSTRSVRETELEGAFFNSEMDVTPETVGKTSLFHSSTGVHAVQALIAQARGDFLLHHTAIRAFTEISKETSEKLDVTLGRAGTLLVCSFLLDASPTPGLSRDLQTLRLLRSLGDETSQMLWQTIDNFAPVREAKELSNLGVAHGWAGLLYSILCWCDVSHTPLSSNLAERLQQLGACAHSSGRGLRWQWDLSRGVNDAGGYMPGWCNGSAGYVFLWTQAHKMLGETHFLELAEGAAWDAWETSSSVGNLCCGLAGQAYALLRLYRYTGEVAWLSRAQNLARSATIAARDLHGETSNRELMLRPESLYKGELGVVVLTADLEQPQNACMPLFEMET